jgi:hypothetical protein
MHFVTLILAGLALILSVLAYQRVEDVSDSVARLSAEANQESIQRGKVLTMSSRIEKMMRSLAGSSKKGAAQ